MRLMSCLISERQDFPTSSIKHQSYSRLAFSSPAPSDKRANLRTASVFQHPLQNRVSRVRIFLPLPRKHLISREIRCFSYFIPWCAVCCVLRGACQAAKLSNPCRLFLTFPFGTASKKHQSRYRSSAVLALHSLGFSLITVMKFLFGDGYRRNRYMSFSLSSISNTTGHCSAKSSMEYRLDQRSGLSV